MTRLVVHMGARKTATSYAQKVLGLNEALFSGDVYLPKTGRHAQYPSIVAHHNLDRELRRDPRFDRGVGGWTELCEELDRERPDTALITCENFEHSVMRYGDGEILVDRLRTCGDAITVVLTVRDWLEYVNSLYCQSVKQLSPTLPFDGYVWDMVEGGETAYTERFGPFLEAPDVMIVLVDYAEIQKSDPLTPILAAGGIRVPERLEWPSDDVNVSLGAIGIEAARILARYLRGRYPEFDRRQTPKLSGYATRASRRRGWSDPRYWGFDPAFAERVLDRVQTDLDAFAMCVSGTPWPTADTRFRERCVVEFDSLSPRDVNRVLEYVKRMEARYIEMRDAHG